MECAIILFIRTTKAQSRRNEIGDIFFVKYRIDKGEVVVKYFPTEYMLADFFTKTLQGNVFKVFWEVIMGHKPLS